MAGGWKMPRCAACKRSLDDVERDPNDAGGALWEAQQHIDEVHRFPLRAIFQLGELRRQEAVEILRLCLGSYAVGGTCEELLDILRGKYPQLRQYSGQIRCE